MAAYCRKRPHESSIVVFSRTPHFIVDGDGSFDPYYVLGIAREPLERLLELAHAVEPAEGARQRAAAIRDAYRELAGALHPDSSRNAQSDRKLIHDSYSWIPRQLRFESVVSASRLLEDLCATLEHRAGRDGRGRTDVETALKRLHRQRAAAVQAAMAVHVAHERAAMAARRDGLLVLLSLYGDLSQCSSELVDPCSPQACVPIWWRPAVSLPPTVCEVTAAVQSLVETSDRDSSTEASTVHLLLKSGSKAKLDGFYDPCDGFPKSLLVRYVFLGKLHQVVVDDEAQVKCPLKRHLVAGAPSIADMASLAESTAPPDRAGQVLRDISNAAQVLPRQVERKKVSFGQASSTSHAPLAVLEARATQRGEDADRASRKRRAALTRRVAVAQEAPASAENPDAPFSRSTASKSQSKGSHGIPYILPVLAGCTLAGGAAWIVWSWNRARQR